MYPRGTEFSGVQNGEMGDCTPKWGTFGNPAHILKRIDELKSDGKWTNQRLAKCLEPNKRKTHWDYLLDVYFTQSDIFRCC